MKHPLLARRVLTRVLVAAALSWPVTLPWIVATPPAGASPTADAAGQPVGYGAAGNYGSTASDHLNSPIIAMASTPDGKGYWLVASDGGIFSFGDAHYYGSTGNIHLNQPIVGIASTPDGKGYWLVASDGGIFSFGDAHYYGSTGNIHLNQPIVGIASTPDGKGYWLVASDGGIFTFGDAHYYGSTGNIHLNQPIVGMASTPNAGGYYLVASDGGVFTFGNARFAGSMGGTKLNAPIVGIATDPHGGYWLGAQDGGVFTFGGAHYYGSLGGEQIPFPVSSIVARPGGNGYWLLPTVHPVTTEPALQLGSTGAAVTTLQQRLSALGYWVGTPDGVFGDSTQQAVWALQKAAGLSRSGVTDSSTWAALDDGVLPHPRSTSGYVIEVDLQDDLVMFVTNGKIDYVLNTSTGGGYTYTEDGETAVAITPQGQFQIIRAVDGLVTDSLGSLWRPRFFYEGFAIHGDSYVPPFPVSHGCVRVSNEAIDWIWANNLAPIGTEFWVY